MSRGRIGGSRGRRVDDAPALGSLSVVSNANRLRMYRRPALAETGTRRQEAQVRVEFQERVSSQEVGMATVKDPVCGMGIGPKGAAAQERRQGKVYYFCSNDYHAKFKAKPKKYAA
ncbi:MAG: YHS domain-containing protein [Dehalococcoidia bacterium]|nr:YHS domain-containing protein [Dehalococcoidia bacterium]